MVTRLNYGSRNILFVFLILIQFCFIAKINRKIIPMLVSSILYVGCLILMMFYLFYWIRLIKSFWFNFNMQYFKYQTKYMLYFILHIGKEAKIKYFIFIIIDCLIQFASMVIVLISNLYCTGFFRDFFIKIQMNFSNYGKNLI